MKTIFKYRERCWGSFNLLYRVGWLDAALNYLNAHREASPYDHDTQRELLRFGARLLSSGQYASKKAHEMECLSISEAKLQ